MRNKKSIEKMEDMILKMREEIGGLRKRIDVIEFTGTFDLNRVKIKHRTCGRICWTCEGPENIAKSSIDVTYVNTDNNIVTVCHVLDKKLDHFDVQIKENDNDQTIFKVNSNLWFKLDKDEETIISIPAPAKYSKAETKPAKK
jgi:hypothetical protein